MPSRKWIDCAALSTAVVVSRWAFRSRYLYDVDSVNFALALDRFDPAAHQPHPPGYFLYVCLGRLVHAAVGDPNTALVLISILASCGAAVMIYALADRWFGRQAARWAGVIFLFSPLGWFHGTVALVYVVEAFFSALIGYLCWQNQRGRTASIPWSAAALGIAAGFRQSSLLMLGPLWLFSVRHASVRKILQGLGVLALAILGWFVPMILAAGGPAVYFESLYALWTLVPARQNTAGPLAMAAGRAVTIAGILLLCLGSAALLFLAPGGSRDPERRAFTKIWLVPALAFFTLVFLKFVNSGYLLLLLPPIAAHLGSRAAAWCDSSRRMLWAGLLAGVNALIFLYAPLYCSRRSVVRFEADLREVVAALPRLADPKTTAIVGLDSHFLGYRHAAYYLPEYLTLQYPAVQSARGKRIFAARRRRTVLLDALPEKEFREFVLFPLPSGPEYDERVSTLRRRLPGDLRVRPAAGRQFLCGSADLLPLLFAASPARQATYTVTHSPR